MAELSFGDIISLFVEERSGFIYSIQSSSVNCQVAAQATTSRKDPEIPHPHAMCWEVVVPSRYKFHKALRKVQAKSYDWDEEKRRQITKNLENAMALANCEETDNQSEQAKQRGTVVTYGEIIELRHVFSGKYLQTTAANPATLDNNLMRMELQHYHAKNSQFRVMPKYKLRVEGDRVLYGDQLVLESIKSPGQYVHVGREVFTEIHACSGSHELASSVNPSSFTLYKSYRPKDLDAKFMRAGDCVQFFHKEVEAYLCAEGLFGPQAMIVTDVHFRVRKIDYNIPKTVFSSSSAIVFWQLEREGAIYDGSVLLWGHQVRLRHLVTRHYLKVTATGKATVTPVKDDPYTVFKLHPATQTSERIPRGTFCRIEHVLTSTWLHALQTEYKQNDSQSRSKSSPQFHLAWSSAPQKKVGVAEKMQFADVFSLTAVEDTIIRDFNFVAGQVPIMKQITNMMSANKSYIAKEKNKIISVLCEIKEFMFVDGKPHKRRQKLLRNLRIIELLVELLRLVDDTPDMQGPCRVINEVYDVLRVYCVGDSRKNELYLAQHYDFFVTRLAIKGAHSQYAASMLMELIRDNLRIIDLITPQHMRVFARLLRRKKDYRYLDLLGVLCVCDGIAIPNNQKYILDTWLLKESKKAVYHTTLGQTISRDINVLYVSKDNSNTWVTIYDLISEDTESTSEDFLFLEHQLDLFSKLCYGGNAYSIEVITEDLKHLTWEEAFSCLADSKLPNDLRAKYCHLIIDLFVTTEDIDLSMDHMKRTFLYHKQTQSQNIKDVDQEGIEQAAVTRRRIAQLQEWVSGFLSTNQRMIASNIGVNTLIEKVLLLVYHMVKMGYYGDSGRMRVLITPMLQLLDGRNDLPYDVTTEASMETDEIRNYNGKLRYQRSEKTEVIINAKYRALQILQLFTNLRLETRVKEFLAEFKRLHQRMIRSQTEAEREVETIVFSSRDDKAEDNDDILSKLFIEGSADFEKDGPRKELVLCHLNRLLQDSVYFQGFDVESILSDLCNYDYNHVVQKSSELLHRIFSIHERVFSCCLQTKILLTDKSCEVFANVENMVPMLHRLTKSRMEESQMDIMEQFLDVLSGYCHIEGDVTSGHPINQHIIYDQGVIEYLFALLGQQASKDVMETYRGLRRLQQKTWRLLGALSRDNEIVQTRMFDSLDMLLSIKGNESQMATALIEVFTGNKMTCMKVQLRQIDNIFSLVAEHLWKAPELLELLKSLVKVEELDLPLRRNQNYVIKCFIQYRQEIAGVLVKSRTERFAMLKEGQSSHISYIVALVDLLASCAEGGNAFIESICQGILGVDEILDILNDISFGDHIKRPFLRYLHHVYLTVRNDDGPAIGKDKRFWNLLLQFRKTFTNLAQFTEKKRDHVQQLFQKSIRLSVLSDKAWDVGDELPLRPPIGNRRFIKQREQSRDSTSDWLTCDRSFYYVMDAVLPFIYYMYTCSFMRKGRRGQKESEVAHYLALALQTYVDAVAPVLTKADDMRLVLTSHRAVLSSTNVPLHMMEALQSRSGLSTKLQNFRSAAQKKYEEYHGGEIEMNEMFQRFTNSYKTLYGGQNTVKAQIGFDSNREYTAVGSDKELPLGPEFQTSVFRFINDDEVSQQPRLSRTKTLIRYFEISGNTVGLSEQERANQEQTNIRCLQILRGLLHNEIIKLDPQQPITTDSQRQQLRRISDMQNVLVDFGAVSKILQHFTSPCEEVVREILAFMVDMLFEGNRKVQESFYAYFKSTREERFFTTCQHRLRLAATAIKERRMLVTQHEAIVSETMSQVRQLKDLVRTGSLGKKDFSSELGSTLLRTSESLGTVELEMSLDELFGSKGSVSGSQILEDDVTNADTMRPEIGARMSGPLSLSSPPLSAISTRLVDMEGLDEDQLEADLMCMVNKSLEELPFEGGGHLELLLKVIGLMCEGHYNDIQDYLREQPDNYQTVNILTYLTALLAQANSSANPRSIDIFTAICHTLVNLVSGNQGNQQTVFDNRLCDCIRSILRSTSSSRLSAGQVLHLRYTVGNLIRAMTENNSSGDTRKGDTPLPLLVMNALDAGIMVEVVIGSYKLEMDGRQDGDLRRKARKVGFQFFHVLLRMADLVGVEDFIEQHFARETNREVVIQHYRTNTHSVEINRDETLQRIYFRVDDQGALRKQVKELFNYGVSRDTNDRIIDFISWSRDVIADVRHTRKVQSVKLTKLASKMEWWMNIAIVLMSFIIVLFMLITWRANPTNLHTYKPVHAYSWGKDLHFALGITHTIITILTVVCYFIAEAPRPPGIFYKLRASYHRRRMAVSNDPYDRSKYAMESDEERAKGDSGNIRIPLISWRTLWFVLLLTFSILGIFSSYFNVFHLLHVATHVQLLKRAIMAVTKNGMSLLLIYIFGLVFFFGYALINFAFYRDILDAETGMFCSTFYECVVTVYGRGLLKGMYEGIPLPDGKPFTTILLKALIDLSFFFFITTIGLNIIFGLIVDTFAELRDTKWKTDQDMNTRCFICGRSSHEFERKQSGFYHHVKKEHNQWAYIFFFMYLEDIPRNEHSALEAYATRRLANGDYEVLPIERAMSLETQTDVRQLRLEMLESRINQLVDRVVNLEADEEQDNERRRQDKWLVEYRALAQTTNYDVPAASLSGARGERRVTFDDVIQEGADEAAD